MDAGTNAGGMTSTEVGSRPVSIGAHPSTRLWVKDVSKTLYFSWVPKKECRFENSSGEGDREKPGTNYGRTRSTSDGAGGVGFEASDPASSGDGGSIMFWKEGFPARGSRGTGVRVLLAGGANLWT